MFDLWAIDRMQERASSLPSSPILVGPLGARKCRVAKDQGRCGQPFNKTVVVCILSLLQWMHLFCAQTKVRVRVTKLGSFRSQSVYTIG